MHVLLAEMEDGRQRRVGNYLAGRWNASDVRIVARVEYRADGGDLAWKSIDLKAGHRVRDGVAFLERTPRRRVRKILPAIIRAVRRQQIDVELRERELLAGSDRYGDAEHPRQSRKERARRRADRRERAARRRRDRANRHGRWT